MYIHMEDVAEAIYHYFIERSKTDVEFAVQVFTAYLDCIHILIS